MTQEKTPQEEQQARIRAGAFAMLPGAVLALIFWLLMFILAVSCVFGTLTHMP